MKKGSKKKAAPCPRKKTYTVCGRKKKGTRKEGTEKKESDGLETGTRKKKPKRKEKPHLLPC